MLLLLGYRLVEIFYSRPFATFVLVQKKRSLAGTGKYSTKRDWDVQRNRNIKITCVSKSVTKSYPRVSVS